MHLSDFTLVPAIRKKNSLPRTFPFNTKLVCSLTLLIYSTLFRPCFALLNCSTISTFQRSSSVQIDLLFLFFFGKVQETERSYRSGLLVESLLVIG